MNSRRWVLAILGGMVLLGLWFAIERLRLTGQRTHALRETQTLAPESPPSAEEQSLSAEPAGQPTVAEAGVGTPLPVEQVQANLEQARIVIRDYRARYGGNPVGNNAEITRALAGGNAKKVNFLAGEAPRVNDKGEMVDAWGTPLFFHQISGEEMEIRSAGPDRRMWTGDDVIK